VVGRPFLTRAAGRVRPASAALGVLAFGAFLAAAVGVAPAAAARPEPARAPAGPLGAAPAELARVEPVADAFVAIGLDEPQGHLGQLFVGELNAADYDSLIRFPMPTDMIGVGATIEKAELVLAKRQCFVTDPGSMAFQVRTVTRNWSEATVIWDNRPSAAGPTVDFVVPDINARGYFRVDITPIVRVWGRGDPNFGIYITATYDRQSRRCMFWSREAGPYPLNQPPLLEITHSGGVTPTFTPTSSPTPSNTPTPSITPSPSITPTPTDTPPITDTPTLTSTPQPKPIFLPILLANGDFTFANTPEPTAETPAIPTDEATPTAPPAETPVPDVLVSLEEANDSGVSGEAALWQLGDDVLVIVGLSGAGPVHASHVHEGSCADLGGIVHPLADVVDGHAETTLTATRLEDVANGDSALAAHGDDGEVVTCGDIAAFTPPRRRR
jgi:hypothetical protein